jgi:hypothetical protein
MGGWRDAGEPTTNPKTFETFLMEAFKIYNIVLKSSSERIEPRCAPAIVTERGSLGSGEAGVKW